MRHIIIILIIVVLGIFAAGLFMKGSEEGSAADVTQNNNSSGLVVDMPGLGETVAGMSQEFPGGILSVQNISYIKGSSTPVQFWASEKSKYAEQYENIFVYGDGAFAIPSGDENILVVICRAEFADGLPEFELRQSKQLLVQNENSKKFSVSREHFKHDVGNYRDYVQLHVINPDRRPVPKKLKIDYFLKDD